MLIGHQEAQLIDGLPRSSRDRLVKIGTYPQPVQITARRIGFVRTEVEAWVASRISERDKHLPRDRNPAIRVTPA